MWRNHRIECTSCSFDSLSLQALITPTQVTVWDGIPAAHADQAQIIWQRIQPRTPLISSLLATEFSTTQASVERIWSQLDNVQRSLWLCVLTPDAGVPELLDPNCG